MLLNTLPAEAPNAPRLAPPVGTASSTAPTANRALPIGLLTTFLTVSTTAETVFLTTLVTLLTTFLSFFLRLYSRNPVIGLMVPAPPRDLSSAASSGLMCARIVSPLRPWSCKNLAIGLSDTGPPSRKFCTSGSASSVGTCERTKRRAERTSMLYSGGNISAGRPSSIASCKSSW